MKKLLLTCGAVALLTGSAGYAQAQVTNPDAWLHGVTVLYKTIVTNEGGGDPGYASVPSDQVTVGGVTTGHPAVYALDGIFITTNVILNQTVTDDADDFAEASAIAAQVNTDNRDCGNCAEKLDVLNGSSDNNTGLTSINQSAGNMNNQGTLVSVAVDVDTDPGGTSGGTGSTGDPSGGGGFAHAQAEATQVNGALDVGREGTTVGGTYYAGNDVEAVDLTFRNALIDNSVNNNKGVSYVNQATGNNTNQLNELAVAFSERNTGVAIAEADLGQFNTGNHVGEGATAATAPIGITKNATVTASLNGNTGIFGVNQSVGNNGNQANTVSVAAIGTNLPGF